MTKTHSTGKFTPRTTKYHNTHHSLPVCRRPINTNEPWAKHYRYTVPNGVRIFMMTLRKHIPSHIILDGHRALSPYEGQSQTCYGCGDTTHTYHVCPKHRLAKTSEPAQVDHTWANIVSGATTPADPPGTSDPTNMDTHTNTGPQTVGEETPSPVTDDGRREPVSTPKEGRQHTRDAPNSQMTMTTELVSSQHTPQNGPTKFPIWSRPQ